MSEVNKPTPMKWLVVIVDRSKGPEVVAHLKARRLEIHASVLGHGTAQSELMELLGLDEKLKEVILVAVPAVMVRDLIYKIADDMNFAMRGTGIAFTLSPTSMNLSTAAEMDAVLAKKENRAYANRTYANKKEEPSMGVSDTYELIINIVDRDMSEVVMDAAKKAGATGGTVIHGRGAGPDDTQKIFKIAVQPEKELVLILALKEDKHAIMQAICDQMYEEVGRHIVSFSLPADDVTGLFRREVPSVPEE